MPRQWPNEFPDLPGGDDTPSGRVIGCLFLVLFLATLGAVLAIYRYWL